MPNLPKNLVKPPSFDNPTRRTAATLADSVTPSTSEAAVPHAPDVDEPRSRAGEGEPNGVVLPFGGSGRTDSHREPIATPIDHRITVRINDDTRRALEAECHKRRIRGEKTNVAEIARGILDHWRTSTAAE